MLYVYYELNELMREMIILYLYDKLMNDDE